MKILIVGSGGREHTLAWKIAQSRQVQKIYCAPGNAGTGLVAENVSIGAEDIPALADFAERNAVDLTVVGPEMPLVAGIADEFAKRKLRVFGPGKAGAEIEGRKVFAKELMKRHGIPTAEFEVFDSADAALAHAKERKAPMVVKADGLAAGKGVLLCHTNDEAEAAVKQVIVEKRFGAAGDRVIIEDMLVGEEASILAFTDGKTVVPMVSAQDHKRALDGDKGLNTGGMGAYSPAPVVTDELQARVMREVMQPTVDAMRKTGRAYMGVLYAGLMMDAEGTPNVLEFNARFGDPETQVVVPLLESDLVDAMGHCIDGTLADAEIKWSEKAATCVVIASGGYPEAYEKGRPISGLDTAEKLQGVHVFHAGTALNNSDVVTAGGRVLGVTGLGATVKESIDRAYAGVAKIKFENMHYRRDIGFRALERVQ